MKTATERHLNAIASGQVTSTNVIGIRKILNHVARLRGGWSGNRSNATPAEADALVAPLSEREPLVRGELHASGVRILTAKRWTKRFGEKESAVIATLQGFRLVRFDWTDDTHATPVFRAVGSAGSFLFRNVPWQTVAYGNGDLESGPTVVAESVA